MTQANLFADDPVQRMNWAPSRHAGLERLKQFQPLAGAHYAKTRNFDMGIEDRSNVSCLSPWIRSRSILEEEVLAHILQRYDVNGAEKFIQEVFWRGYFKGWLEHRPSVWQDFCQDLAAFHHQLAADEDLNTRHQAAIEGRTGIACFDHWTRELIETGYLHNHARMWFASIWIFTLRLPWQMGAGFFLTHLLDGDPAANTLSWRWVGGLHTKGKNYLARADNIQRCTQGRFNPAGQLDESAVPLWEDLERPRLPRGQQASWQSPQR
ncbi:MAG: FAD-binding domain-containing protein, partial [Pseudomonadota bacterium]